MVSISKFRQESHFLENLGILFCLECQEILFWWLGVNLLERAVLLLRVFRGDNGVCRSWYYVVGPVCT